MRGSPNGLLPLCKTQTDNTTLLPVLVQECKLTGIIGAIAYIVSLDEATASETLLVGIHRSGIKPSTAPGVLGTGYPFTMCLIAAISSSLDANNSYFSSVRP